MDDHMGYDQYALRLAGWIVSDKAVYDDFIAWSVSGEDYCTITDRLLIYGYMNTYNIRADMVRTEDEWNRSGEAVTDYSRPFVVLRSDGENEQYTMAYDISDTTAAGRKEGVFYGEDIGYKVDALLLAAPIQLEYSEKITGTCASYSAKDGCIYLRNGCEKFSDVFAFAINEYLMCEIHMLMKDEGFMQMYAPSLKDMEFSRTEFMYDAYSAALALCELLEVDVILKRKKEVPIPAKWSEITNSAARDRLALTIEAAQMIKELYLRGVGEMQETTDYFRNQKEMV